jgi:hypothetical protein
VLGEPDAERASELLRTRTTTRVCDGSSKGEAAPSLMRRSQPGRLIGNPNEFSIPRIGLDSDRADGLPLAHCTTPASSGRPTAASAGYFPGESASIVDSEDFFKDGLIKTIAYFNELLKDDGVRATLTGRSLEPA